MSDKPTTQRFGATQPPPPGEPARRPMPGPLMTAPVPLQAPEVATAPVAAPRLRPATVNPGANPAATAIMPVAGAASLAVSGGTSLRDAGPAPEISLTQHHLPNDEQGTDPRLVLLTDPDSEQAANFRVLRHHILEAGRPQVIVVSSARADEGKTTTAANLALALAECGRAKVLLVEANLRRPQLAGMFRVVPSWCFAEQLAAHRHQPLLPWSLIDIPQLWLHVAAVSPRIEQNQLLDAPAFAIAMERLRLGGYDHIVIDSPPILGSADVNLIQDAADGVLLTLRGRVSTARDLRRAIDQLSPARVLGSVLLE